MHTYTQFKHQQEVQVCEEVEAPQQELKALHAAEVNAHTESKSKHKETLTTHKEFISVVDKVYAQLPKLVDDKPDTLAPHKICMVRECVQFLETQNIELREKLKWPTPDN